MELRPPWAKKSHTQSSSAWNAIQNGKMPLPQKNRELQNTLEHKSLPPRPFQNILLNWVRLQPLSVSLHIPD